VPAEVSHRSIHILRGHDTPELLELGLQLPVLALEQYHASPLGHEILGHLAQRTPNPLGFDLLHFAAG
jgi:hypothetical protein